MNAIPLPIIDTSQNRGGSGNGISVHLTAARCPRRARLDKETQGSSNPGEDAKTGIIFHALCDIFYSGDIGEDPSPLYAIQVSDVAYKDAAIEAVRLARAYFAKFPERDFWGEVIGSEMQFPTPGNELAVRGAFGVDLTARLDLVTRVSLHHADRIQARTGMTLLPGVYIIDHKTKSRRESDPAMTFSLSAQFRAYPQMWDLHNPGDPCMGMIANIVVGNKEPAFQQALIPPPTEVEKVGLANFLMGAAALATSDFPNWAACKDFNRVCPHYTSGRCSRA